MKLNINTLLLIICSTLLCGTKIEQRLPPEENNLGSSALHLESISHKFLLTFLPTCDRTLECELISLDKTRTADTHQSEEIANSLQRIKLDALKLHFDIVKIRLSLKQNRALETPNDIFITSKL